MISVGVDVSKDHSTVCIMRPGGEILIEPYDMPHTNDYVSVLASCLLSYQEDVRVVLEVTGHYHLPVVNVLIEQGIFVSCINPLQMKKYSAQSIRKGKTDKIDSIKIAQYGITYWNDLVPYEPNAETYAELHSFSRQYYIYMGMLIKAKINLDILLDQVMPGINKILADQEGRHNLTDFVKKHWHYDRISCKSEHEFILGYNKWAKAKRCHHSESKAKRIYEQAQNNIPVLPCNGSTKILIHEAIRMVRELEKSRDKILEHMQNLACVLPEYDIMIAMCGVGPVLATRMIAEIGDVRRFHSRNALIAFAGIDAPPYQSGAFTSQNRRISKRGNKYLRKTGYEIMLSIMRKKPSKDNAVYQYILKKESEGKSKKTAKIAGLNKFLRIYYARVIEAYN